MPLKERYASAKARLLSDRKICAENRELFKEFFVYEEYKLKRINCRPTLDDNSYKTLLGYTSRLRVVNRWFENKPWKSLERHDIQRVYDALEDGEIVTRFGKPLRDAQTYYRIILRGKPFEMAGKKALVNEVMQFNVGRPREEVRFIKEEDFRRLVETTTKTEQRAFLWLCWDIGENATSIVKLRKRDCVAQINEYTREREYLINLRKDILKRSRRPRSEITNAPETVHYLDLVLQDIGEDDLLFGFGQAWGKKFLLRAVGKTGVRCLPNGQRPTLKDLRSSMACNLLSKGWSRDEVNARLGHAPSSKEMDKYINYLALDKVRPKQKLHENQVRKLAEDLAQMEQRFKFTVSDFTHFKEASQAQVQHLMRLLEIQNQIAVHTVAHELGRLGVNEYEQLLKKRLRDLINEKNRGSALPRILRSNDLSDVDYESKG